jgi:AcrR family transcriptional regulator
MKKVQTKIKNPKRVQRRREQIIEGAIKVFSQKGYHNAKTKEIAEASGVTEGTLYNYIRSKEDITFIVYDYITGILRDELKKAINGVKDPEKRLKAALLQNMKTINRHQDIIMFMYTESSSLDKPSLYTILTRESEYIEIFENLLRDYFRETELNENNLKMAADLLAYIPVILTLRRWSLKRRFESMETVIQGILDFVLHGIAFIPEVATIPSLKGAADEETR